MGESSNITKNLWSTPRSMAIVLQVSGTSLESFGPLGIVLFALPPKTVSMKELKAETNQSLTVQWAVHDLAVEGRVEYHFMNSYGPTSYHRVCLREG